MASDRSNTWRYGVCGLLLCATMLNYMDRQTLAQLAKTISDEYRLSNEQYGELDSGFSLAFATGGIFFGFLADRLSPRWLYAAVVFGWSAAGLATAYSITIGSWFRADATVPDQAYLGFMICRVVLGFFEAGHWPCALITTQTILTRINRSLGNSILQSGAAVGAAITPFIVVGMITNEPGGWRPPFAFIGCLAIFWIVPWLVLMRDRDFERPTAQPDASASSDAPSLALWHKFAILVVVVLCINIPWQSFRVWLPKYLEETHAYAKEQVGWFTSAYYLSSMVGCFGVGFLVKWLLGRGWKVHHAWLGTFTACAVLTSLAVLVPLAPTGPWLIFLLMLVGMGAMGLFPNYYSLAQELSHSHFGKLNGILSATAWVGSAIMQRLFGRNIDQTQSYAGGIIVAGLVPLLACVVLWLFWRRQTP